MQKTMKLFKKTSQKMSYCSLLMNIVAHTFLSQDHFKHKMSEEKNYSGAFTTGVFFPL